MGAGASKAAGKAAGAVGRRQYPSSSSILNSAPSTSNAPGSASSASMNPRQGPRSAEVHPDPSVSPPTDTKEAHVDLDGRDPQFGSALRRLGVVEHQNYSFAASPSTPISPTNVTGKYNDVRAPDQPPPPHQQPGPSQQQENQFQNQQQFPQFQAQQFQDQKGVFPSQSAKTNPAIAVVEARGRISKLFDEENENRGRNSYTGRTLLSATEIKEALRQRDQAGRSIGDVEKEMRLRPGVLESLATKGVFANV